MRFSKIKIAAALFTVLLIAGAGWAQNDVTFQLNMNVQQFLGNFNPTAGDCVVVRGSFNGWSGNANQGALVDTLYTCTVSMATGAIEYKYVIIPGDGSPDVWEGVPNRTFDVPGGGATIPPVYFNDQGWVFTDVEVLFRVDMTVQILNGNFVPASDWIIVRGGHANLGNWGGTGSGALVLETGSGDIYSGWVQFDQLSVGQVIEYKFVILTGGDPAQANWEQSDNRSFSPTGTEPDDLPPPSGNGYGEITPDVVYFSNIDPSMILTQDVMVNFHVDLYPAYGKLDSIGYIIDVQTGADTVWTIDYVAVAGFFNNWPWGSFDPMFWAHDDGVAPDSAAGDSIWAAAIQFYAGDPRELIYKYGLNGYDNEAGFAQNHSVMIDDSGPDFTIWPTDTFGWQGNLYDPWIGVIEHQTPQLPTHYGLLQNHPNPFNPATNISFELPAPSEVSLKVFNTAGQEVYRYVNGRLNAGVYHIPFDGSNLSSGIYFYQLRAGDYLASRKMVLVK